MEICTAIGKVFSTEPCELRVGSLLLQTKFPVNVCKVGKRITNSCIVEAALLVSFQLHPETGQPLPLQHRMWQEGMSSPPHPSIPPPHTNHPPQISKKPQRGILAVLSPGPQPAQIKKMASRCKAPSPPPLL